MIELISKQVYERLKPTHPEIYFENYFGMSLYVGTICNEEQQWKVRLEYHNGFVICTVLSIYGIRVPDVINSVQKQVEDILNQVMEEHSISCLLCFQDVYYATPDILIAKGQDAKQFLHLMKEFNKHYRVFCHASGAHIDGEYTSYDVPYSFEEASLKLYKNGDEVVQLKTKEEIDAFVNQEQKTAEDMNVLEDQLVTFAQQLEATTYYKRKNKAGSYLFMFGNKIPFSITKIGVNRKARYKAHFNRSSLSAKTLTELETKMRKKLEEYYKKTRLKVVTNKNFDMFERHLYHMTGSRITKSIFKTKLSSPLPFEHVEHVISHSPAETLKEGSPDDEKWFLAYLTHSRLRHKLKKSYQIQTLRIFLTGTTYFIFEESHMQDLFQKKA